MHDSRFVLVPSQRSVSDVTSQLFDEVHTRSPSREDVAEPAVKARVQSAHALLRLSRASPSRDRNQVLPTTVNVVWYRFHTSSSYSCSGSSAATHNSRATQNSSVLNRDVTQRSISGHAAVHDSRSQCARSQAPAKKTGDVREDGGAPERDEDGHAVQVSVWMQDVFHWLMYRLLVC